MFMLSVWPELSLTEIDFCGRPPESYMEHKSNCYNMGVFFSRNYGWYCIMLSNLQEKRLTLSSSPCTFSKLLSASAGVLKIARAEYLSPLTFLLFCNQIVHHVRLLDRVNTNCTPSNLTTSIAVLHDMKF